MVINDLRLHLVPDDIAFVCHSPEMEVEILPSAWQHLHPEWVIEVKQVSQRQMQVSPSSSRASSALQPLDHFPPARGGLRHSHSHRDLSFPKSAHTHAGVIPKHAYSRLDLRHGATNGRMAFNMYHQSPTLASSPASSDLYAYAGNRRDDWGYDYSGYVTHESWVHPLESTSYAVPNAHGKPRP